MAIPALRVQMAGNSPSELEPSGLSPSMVPLYQPALSPALQGFLIAWG